MNSKKLYDILEKNKNADIMAIISSILEYMVNNRGIDFDTMIQDIKEVHEVINKRGGKNE